MLLELVAQFDHAVNTLTVLFNIYILYTYSLLLNLLYISIHVHGHGVHSATKGDPHAVRVQIILMIIPITYSN